MNISTENLFCQQQHAQLDLFDERLPNKLYCTDNLESGLVVRGKKWASRKRYIQVNPPWLRSYIVLDLDYNDSVLSWQHNELPEPAWTSMNLANGHCHMSYAIDAPVLLGEHSSQKAMKYLAAVEAAMIEKMSSDINYSGLITKNPKNAHWRTLWGRFSYDLDYLSEFLDLKRFSPKRKPEQVGLGRNCDAFDHIRLHAYAKLEEWKSKKERGIYVRWQNYIYERIMNYTHNEHINPLDNRECHAIARSVAKWVWNKFDYEESNRNFSDLQAFRGKRGGIAKGQANEDKRASARLMRAAGKSLREIAVELGVGKSTVADWL
jgi:hypothetical protein